MGRAGTAMAAIGPSTHSGMTSKSFSNAILGRLEMFILAALRPRAIDDGTGTVYSVRFEADGPEEAAFWKSMTLKDKAPYRGEWIAIAGSSIVAHGEDLDTVNKAGRKAAGRWPMMRLVSIDRGLPEAEFREEMMPCDDDPYRGGWIAICGRKIVAHGKDELDVLKAADKATGASFPSCTT